MRNLHRYIPALVLVVLYALIVLSPLAPLAMHSPVIAHAITGECAADCSICGCSPERSANHTCCCWQKKRLHEHEADQDEPDCCKKSKIDNNITTQINSLPCNSAKMAALIGISNGDVLPYFFSSGDLNVFDSSLVAHHPDCQIEWFGEPPKPPPKLIS
jgi:hypothetical protein